MALKPCLFCHQIFVKLKFHDKVTGFWAFEGHLPYQKYHRPPIAVRYPLISIMCVYFILIWPILEIRAEICQKFRLCFGQWSFKKECFWDLLTFFCCYLIYCRVFRNKLQPIVGPLRGLLRMEDQLLGSFGGPFGSRLTYSYARNFLVCL